MFGKKKQKQETLVRMRNLAQLDEGFYPPDFFCDSALH